MNIRNYEIVPNDKYIFKLLLSRLAGSTFIRLIYILSDWRNELKLILNEQYFFMDFHFLQFLARCPLVGLAKL